MAERDVERLRENYAAFNRGDIDGALRHMAPEIEFSRPQELPGAGGDYRGLEGIRTALSDLQSAFDDLRYEIERVVDLDDTIVVLFMMSGRGKGSGVPFELHAGHVFELRDGVAVRWGAYIDQKSALEAAGVESAD